jgi:hypothetical protein
MAKIRHCEELQHGPVTELFPGLQTNSTDRTDRTDSTDREYLSDEEFSEYVRRQVLRKETTSQPTADSTDDPDLPSYDEIAEAMGVAAKKPKFKIERV